MGGRNSMSYFHEINDYRTYVGKDADEVQRFITQTVFGGDDPMLPVREAFYNKYLVPPNGKTVAQNVYDDIVASLFP